MKKKIGDLTPLDKRLKKISKQDNDFLIYNGQKYDSKEEVYFAWYLDELKEKGYVNSWHYHPKQFDLTMGFYYYVTEQKKRGGEKTTAYTLAQPQTYTPDFMICWSGNGSVLFGKYLFNNSEHIYGAHHNALKQYFWYQIEPYAYTTYIDVKPMFSKRNSDTAMFSLKRALMLQMHHVHVQKVVIQDCFAKTFTPQRFLTCDEKPNKRKINWEIKQL